MVMVSALPPLNLRIINKKVRKSKLSKNEDCLTNVFDEEVSVHFQDFPCSV